MDGAEDHDVKGNKTDSERLVAHVSFICRSRKKNKDMKVEGGMLGKKKIIEVKKGANERVTGDEYEKYIICMKISQGNPRVSIVQLIYANKIFEI
jgi:hypothetical protein